MTSNQAIVVHWIDTGAVYDAAKAEGWNEASADSLMDVVDVDSYEKAREFQNLTTAKAWACRNRALDLWNAPDISVYKWPSERRLSWERETVKRLRYIGDGCGWEEIEGAAQ